jgi:hypothetical protein
LATSKEVNESIKRILDICSGTLVAKGKAYSGGSRDRLENFKVASIINAHGLHCIKGMNQKKILWGYLLKHLTSINYMCIAGAKGTPKPSRADWDEKIGDSINYLLLLSAMVDEEIREEARLGDPIREDIQEERSVAKQAKYCRNPEMQHKKTSLLLKRVEEAMQ